MEDSNVPLCFFKVTLKAHFFPPTNVYGVNAKQGADLGALQERHANVSDLDLTLRMLQRQTHLQIEHLTRC